MLEWLRKTAGTVDVMMSVCTGARHLAKAGLLDGKQATSHHEAIDEHTVKRTAIDDPDLKPLWDSMSGTRW